MNDADFASVRLREGRDDGTLLATKYPNREPPIARWVLTEWGKMRGLVVHWDGSLTIPSDKAEAHSVVTEGEPDGKPLKTQDVIVRFPGIKYPSNLVKK